MPLRSFHEFQLWRKEATGRHQTSCYREQATNKLKRDSWPPRTHIPQCPQQAASYALHTRSLLIRIRSDAQPERRKSQLGRFAPNRACPRPSPDLLHRARQCRSPGLLSSEVGFLVSCLAHWRSLNDIMSPSPDPFPSRGRSLQLYAAHSFRPTTARLSLSFTAPRVPHVPLHTSHEHWLTTDTTYRYATRMVHLTLAASLKLGQTWPEDFHLTPSRNLARGPPDISSLPQWRP